MATMGINLAGEIHAEIAEGNRYMLSNTSITLDPLTKSYSTIAPLVNYELIVQNVQGVKDYRLLHNGKNSRFSTAGVGSCDIKLILRDEAGNVAEDIITIIVE